jgi:hypothetical protein
MTVIHIQLKKLVASLALPCLAVLLLLAFALPASADSGLSASTGPQEWYLSSSVSTITGKIMMRTYNTSTGSVYLPPASTQYWLSDVPALWDCHFSEGLWVIQLKTDSYWGDVSSSRCRIAIGEWDVLASSFNVFTTSTLMNLVDDNGVHILRAEFQASTYIVHQHNYLTLRIMNQDLIPHVIFTDGQSSVKSPNSDPGYPRPEISPDSVAAIQAYPRNIYPSGYVTLIVQDTNTGNVPLDNSTMRLVSSDGSLDVLLTRYSSTFYSGDLNHNNLFDPGETWVWRVRMVYVDSNVIFTATGNGYDPYGNPVTAPQHPTEQVSVQVTNIPGAPSFTLPGLALFVGLFAVALVVVSRRPSRRSIKR